MKVRLALQKMTEKEIFNICIYVSNMYMLTSTIIQRREQNL